MSDMAFAAITRLRAIPASSTILVFQGATVEPGTAIARTEILPGKLWRVDVASDLKVGRTEASGRMIVRPGQRVAAGEVVAVGGRFFERAVARSPVKGVLALVSRTRGLAYIREDVETGSQEGPVEVPVAQLLGVPPIAIMAYKDADANMGVSTAKGQPLARFGKTVVPCPVYGRITGISPVKGTITVTPHFRSQVIHAYMKGQVERVLPGVGVEVSGQARAITGAWGLGAEAYGRLYVVDGDLSPEAPLTEGSIVAASGTATYEGLLNAAVAGVRGVVLGWLRSGIAIRFSGGIKNMGITGDEAVPFPIVLLEGFLAQPIRHEVFDILNASEGSQCSLIGATHIRAGVVRPEVLIFPK